MHCNEVQGLLSAYTDNELTAEEKLQLDKHLAECHNCAQILQQYHSLNKNTVQLTLEPPSDLKRNVMRAVYEITKKEETNRKRKFFIQWLRVAGVAVASILIILGLLMWKNDIKKVSAEEIVMRMAKTLENVDSYHIEINIEETKFKTNGQEELQKGKIIEYMKKPYFQRIEKDLPYKELRITNGEKQYNSFSNNNFSESQVITNPMNLTQSQTLGQLSKYEILKGMNKKSLKLIGETVFNGRTAYQIQGNLIDYQKIAKEPNSGWSPDTKRIEATMELLIDKETSIPLKTAYYKDNEKKPYRQSVYTVFKLNDQINDQLFSIPRASKEFPGWRQVNDIEAANKLIKEKIDLPQYLPQGAKLNKIGFANSKNIRVEYLIGNNVIYITYGWPLNEGGGDMKIGDIWFNSVSENFWSSSLSVQKGNSIVHVEGTISLNELAKIAESVLTPQEKEDKIARDKFRKELLATLKATPKDINVNNNKYNGVIKSLKISAVSLGESAWGAEKYKSTTYYQAPFYIHRESYEGSQLSYISINNVNKHMISRVTGELSITDEPLRGLFPVYDAEDEAEKSGKDPIISRKIIGHNKYLNRAVTVVEYSYNYAKLDPGIQIDLKAQRTSKSKLYIDDETGIILKRIETINNKEKVNYYVTEILINLEINKRLFEIPPNIKPDTNEQIQFNINYQEVPLEQLKQKATVNVKIPQYLPENTKLVSASTFYVEPRKTEALQLYSIDSKPLLIYSKKKYRGEKIEYITPQLIDIGGLQYYYGQRGKTIIIESVGEGSATHIESTLPLEELKKIIASLQ